MSEKHLSEFRIHIPKLIDCKQPHWNKTKKKYVLINRQTKLKITKRIETHHFSGQYENRSSLQAQLRSHMEVLLILQYNHLITTPGQNGHGW